MDVLGSKLSWIFLASIFVATAVFSDLASAQQFDSSDQVASIDVEMSSVAEQTVANPIALGSKPVIRDFRVLYYAGYVLVTGRVTDADGDPGGLTVNIYGSVSGDATTGSDGRFVFVVPYDYPYGEVYGVAEDSDGNQSWVVSAEFYE